MPRINVVTKSRKVHACGACGDVIPQGGSYRKIKPRYGSEKIRCMKPSCAFKPTDLSSSKAARIEEAIDEARTAIELAGGFDEIHSALEDCAMVAREVAEEYQDASDNWAGGNGNEEFQEKSSTCGDFADELEGWSFSGEDEEDAVREKAAEDVDREEGEDDEAFQARVTEEQDEAWDNALQDMREEASDLLDEFSL